MKKLTVIFEEPLHHVCLMHGLKQTYDRMPFLNKRVLEVRGKVMTIDNVVSPPPLMNYRQENKHERAEKYGCGLILEE